MDLPTSEGSFELRAFEVGRHTHLVLSKGDLRGPGPVLTRIHSECLTGDVLGSLRCDCGLQLRTSMRRISAEGRGILIYVSGHEGRGIGLVNKLRAYLEQEAGADTLEANLRLGFPADRRDYSACGAILEALGISSVILLTNNPAKVEAMRSLGIDVAGCVPMPLAPHSRSVDYLETKVSRMGHQSSTQPSTPLEDLPPDVGALLGDVRPHEGRPYVVVKYAQSIDGRIATTTGDSKWISGVAERTLSHSLRARCDAVMVGAETAVTDDPRLTVRLVVGASPLRVLVDSRLRVPLESHLFEPESPTTVLTTMAADPMKLRRLRSRGIRAIVLPAHRDGVDMGAGLAGLAAGGTQSVIVEGGARLITSLIRSRLVDRLIVAVAPTILGRGLEAVGDLGITQVMEGLKLSNRKVQVAGEDVLLAGDVGYEKEEAPAS